MKAEGASREGRTARNAQQPLHEGQDLHRRVGTTILFESSGGQTEKVAHLPELRYALGEPAVDTTSIDNAAVALEGRSYYIRRVGSDGFKISHQPTLKKVVNDRRASLDEETEIKPAIRKLVKAEFDRGATMPLLPFPADGAAVPDSPRLTLILLDPESEWTGTGALRERIGEWTKQRGGSGRFYPGALIWCAKKPGRDLREKVEAWLAWRRVAWEIAEGSLKGDFEPAERSEIKVRVGDAEDDAKEEVWASYTFAVLADNQEADGLRAIDFRAGHSSSGGTLCGRVIAAMKAEALFNESIGAGYIERHWPAALKESGAWPLAGLRQSFLNGAFTRLLDADGTLRGKIVDFVAAGDFGLASGQKPDGSYDRVWYREPISEYEVAFESGVFLLTRTWAEALKAGEPAGAKPGPEPTPESRPEPPQGPGTAPVVSGRTTTIRLTGAIPPELWNRLGTKVLPKLRSGSDLRVGIEFSVAVKADEARSLVADLEQILKDLGVAPTVRIEEQASS